MNTKQLYKISKYTYKEAFLDYTLTMSPSSQDDIKKKMVKNPRYLKQQTLTMKIVLGLYLIALILIPIQVFNYLKSVRGNAAIDLAGLQLSSGLLMAIYFFIQMMFLLMIGMFQGSSILNSDNFIWLSTLPIEEKDIQKISLFTFFRAMDTSVIGLVLTLPIGLFIATTNIWLTLIALLISLINSLVSYSVLVILSGAIHRVIHGNQANTRRNKIIRILWLGSYVIVIMTIGVGLNIAITSITPFLQSNDIPASQSLIWNNRLPWIPLGFSQGYLLTNFYLGTLDSEMIVPIIIALAIFLLTGMLLAQKALKRLTTVIFSEEKGVSLSNKEIQLDDIELQMQTEEDAFFSKDKNMATRDMQFLMFIMMALILPSVSLLFSLLGSDDYQGVEMILLIVSIYLFMGVNMILIGALNLDKSGATIITSLPIIERKKAKAKLRWPLLLSPLSLLLPSIYIYFTEPIYKWDYIIYFIVIMLMALLSGIAMLEIKTLLFGKMKYKYVLEDINTNNKVLKWISITVLGFILAMVVSIFGMGIMLDQGITRVLVIFLPIECGVLFVETLIFNWMFPKLDQIS